MLLGAHVSISGGVSQAPLNARELGISTIQIFTKNQQQWTAPPLTDDEIARWFKNSADCGVEIVVSHDSYLINLCAVEKAKLAMSREAFQDEMKRADQLKIPYLVTHPGSHMKAGEEAGLRMIAESLRMLFDRQPDGKVRVLLETTAGQGTNLGYKFEHIAELLRMVNNPDRMGVCLDTCHIHSAGYDWTTAEGYESVFDEFDRIIGLNNLFCFHLNDTKKELGSNVDRHEHIGGGFIGREPFRRLLNDPRFQNVPGLLETPGEREDYARNLQIMRSLIAG